MESASPIVGRAQQSKHMLYRHVSDHCLAGTIGEGGLSDGAFEKALTETRAALDDLRSPATQPAFLRIPRPRLQFKTFRYQGVAFRERFDDVVVLGTGGASLGGRALAGLSRPSDPYLSLPRVHFTYSIDPATWETLLESLDLSRSGFLVISKSGSTAETLAQTLTVLPILEKAVGREKLAEHVLVITEPFDNPLRRLATRYQLGCLDHDPDVGGRFSVLTVVGVLPALIAGLDTKALREGAMEVLEETIGAGSPAESPPAVGAASSVGLLRERAVDQTVLMSYCDPLAPFGDWYRQLWAESLGKDGKGTTPICGMGPIDQHSQLQLYLQGPPDKLFTLITVDAAGKGWPIDATPLEDSSVDFLAALTTRDVDQPGLETASEAHYLNGRRLGDLIMAEARATADTLAGNGRPVRRIEIEQLDERCLGGLLMHFMLETVIAARLLGVDPYDQPAVEEGKRLARAYLREGGR
jgi:glucose-6-phosphate isomerase